MPCSKRARASGELVVMGMRSGRTPAAGVCAATATAREAASSPNKAQRRICRWFFILLISTEDVAVLHRQFTVNLQHLDLMIDAKYINQPYCARYGVHRVQHGFIGINDHDVVMMLGYEIPQILRTGFVDA